MIDPSRIAQEQMLLDMLHQKNGIIIALFRQCTAQLKEIETLKTTIEETRCNRKIPE